MVALQWPGSTQRQAQKTRVLSLVYSRALSLTEQASAPSSPRLRSVTGTNTTASHAHSCQSACLAAHLTELSTFDQIEL